jgi:hypothetical protein
LKSFILILVITCLAVSMCQAHEPLYGFGPHVLFKGGLAPRITLNWEENRFSTEYALGYGITRKWTMIAETPFYTDNNAYKYGGFNLKSKYRFWLKTKPGKSYQASFISKLSLPSGNDDPTALTLALTTGQEALKLYWFATAGYVLKFTDNELSPGNNLLYNVTLGYRPFKVNYYKPDIVFFVEFYGNSYAKSNLNGDRVEQSGGTTMALAPTFFFTYRNFALRGGVQFGVIESDYVTKPATSFKLTFEVHF